MTICESEKSSAIQCLSDAKAATVLKSHIMVKYGGVEVTPQGILLAELEGREYLTAH